MADQDIRYNQSLVSLAEIRKEYDKMNQANDKVVEELLQKLEEKKKFIRYAFAFAYIWSIASSVEDRF